MSQEATKLAKGQISVGGKPFTPVYSFQSYIDMHEKHGVNVFELNATPKTVIVLIWGAITHIAPTITIEEIGRTISIKEAIHCNRVLTKLLLENLPRREVEDAEGKDTA
jgi:uncharacterized protein YqjF (DUF2071 family)